MRLLVLLMAGALIASAQSPLVIGWVSDHGISNPHGLGFDSGTGGQRSTDTRAQMDVAAMVRSWNPDFYIATGDLSNIRGNRAETYKGLLVRTETAVTCPSPSGATTLQEAVTAGSVSSQTKDVSAIMSTGTYVINCGMPNAEVIIVTARTTGSPPTITAEFYEPHAVGEPIQLNSQTITVDETPDSDCVPGACLTDMMLFGADRTYTVGGSPSLTNIVASGGTCTATISTGVITFASGGEVIVTGDAAVEGTYVIGSGGTTSTINWPCSSTDGTYTTSGLSVQARRLAIIGSSGLYVGYDEEDPDAFEIIRLTSVTKTTFTATFSQPHDAGVILRASDQMTYMDVIRQGLFLPVIGNHDVGCGTLDWCEGPSGSTTLATVFHEFWASEAGGSWPLSTLTYHTKSYGTTPAGNALVTFFAAATSGIYSSQRNNQQEDYFTPLMSASTAKWNISLTHFPVLSDTLDTSLNSLGVGTNNLTNYGWIAGTNVDAVLSGHLQYPEHTTADNDAGSTSTLPYLVMGTSGDSVTSGGAGGNYADSDLVAINAVCVWGDTTACTDNTATATYMAGKITVSDTEFKVEYFTRNNWTTPIHTVTLTKSASGVGDPCAAVTRLCISGGVTIQ